MKKSYRGGSGPPPGLSPRRGEGKVTLASFCRETGVIPRSASRCQMIARVERALRRAFNKRAQERPLHLERFATETS